jgi:hypothetical protein
MTGNKQTVAIESDRAIACNGSNRDSPIGYAERSEAHQSLCNGNIVASYLLFFNII